MPSRRGFLGLLGGAAAGALLMDVPRFLVFDPKRLDTERGPLTLDRMLAEFAREFDMALRGHTLVHVPCPAGARLGDNLGGYVMTEQRKLDLRLPREEEMDWRERYILPAAETMAAEVKYSGITVVSDLAVPIAGLQSVSGARTSTGTPARGLICYDISQDMHYLRFDIIGAAA